MMTATVFCLLLPPNTGCFGSIMGNRDAAQGSKVSLYLTLTSFQPTHQRPYFHFSVPKVENRLICIRGGVNLKKERSEGAPNLASCI